MSSITLYIAEKPSMARDIARVLGAKKRDGIKIVGPNVWVSWCIGHLVEIAQPAQHDPRWKSWQLKQLPILPDALKWVPKQKTKAHFKQLATLIKSRQVTRIVNACDAGREGELIFRAVYQTAGGRKPVSRFWVSSLTTEAIKLGLKQLKPSQDFDPLGSAAYCRAEADWLVGMNATRALTSRATGLLSLGRVQTPTLNMIVRRQHEIDSFVPTKYWILEAQIESQTGAQWLARWSRQTNHNQAQEDDDIKPDQPMSKAYWFNSPQEAQKIIDKIKGQIGVVSRAEGKEKSIPPPLLFHLTALQQVCNRRFGFTADRTLEIAQSLYETHKIISYPRTDSRYLTPDVAKEIPKILKALSPPWQALTHTLSTRKLGRRYINAQKVTDHHAIIPTHRSCDPQRLSRAEHQVFDLIVRSLLSALSPAAIDQQAILEVLIAEERFVAKGRVELKAGWRAVAPPSKQPKQNSQLPYVPLGTPARAFDTMILDKQTQPPKLYNDASLLGAMEHAGKKLEDESLRAVMKSGGLGTPATRANIIDTLIRRCYIKRLHKSLHPTEAGKLLVSSVNDLALLEPQMTAEWEKRLQDIAEGNASPNLFIQEIRSWVSQLVSQLPQGPKIMVPESGKNKKQKAHRSKGKGSTYSASSSASSSTSKWASNRSSRTNNDQSSQRSSKPTKKVFNGDLDEIIGKRCPMCKVGEMIQGQRGWGCQRWREGCQFVIWFELDQVIIPKEEAARLCVRRKSRLFHEVDGKKYRLELTSSGQFTWISNSKVKRNKGSR